MANITFGFSRPKKFKILSWIIMKSTKVPYSHVYIKLYSEKYGRFLIYQASSTMVNFMNIETFKDHTNVIHEVDVSIPDETRNNIMRFAIDHCGQPYGVKELLGLGIVLLASSVGKTIKNPFSNKNTWVCAGLVSEIIKEHLKSIVELESDPEDMTPKDVYEVLVKYNSKVVDL